MVCRSCRPCQKIAVVRETGLLGNISSSCIAMDNLDYMQTNEIYIVYCCAKRWPEAVPAVARFLMELFDCIGIPEPHHYFHNYCSASSLKSKWHCWMKKLLETQLM